MIEIRQLKLPVDHTKKDLTLAIKKRLRGEIAFTYSINKKSIDSRKKNELKYVYNVLVSVKDESALLKRLKHDKDISKYTSAGYKEPKTGSGRLSVPPVIVGAGPAGLFCALMLAKAGYCPRVIERGADVDTRVKDICSFWDTSVLKPDSNVQFGEGGAGTFSDGKLNTLVRDKYGRNQKVLETFVEYGAPKDILIDSRPHIGTDKLRLVIKNMRNAIIKYGGSVEFQTKLANLITDEHGKLTSIQVEKCGASVTETIPADVLVLAPGHSARDTFYMLFDKHIEMTAKPFAIGLRLEHRREMIEQSQYGMGADVLGLPAATYKLTYQAEDNRGVFSFCMCPGGFVVNASSEQRMLAVNGMSNHDRMERNSNSAIIVTVTPEDFDGDGPLAGIEFQRKWERAAYECGNGAVPVQRFEDLCLGKITERFGTVVPNIKGAYCMADLNKCLPDYVIHDIISGIYDFEKKIRGFSDGDTVLSGIESRTSSPVRMIRNDDFESNVKGVYPCGEGAGYAGGITSAAMDGIKVYEAIAKTYAPFHRLAHAK